MNLDNVRKRKKGCISRKNLQKLSTTFSVNLFEEFSRELDTDELTSNDKETESPRKIPRISEQASHFSKSAFPSDSATPLASTSTNKTSILSQDKRTVICDLDPVVYRNPAHQELNNLKTRTTSPILLHNEDFIFPDNIKEISQDFIDDDAACSTISIEDDCNEPLNEELIENIDHVEEIQTDVIEESNLPMETILKAIGKLLQDVIQQRSVIDKIVKRIETIETLIPMTINESKNSSLLGFPLNTIKEMEELDHSLKIDPNTYKEMVKFVWQIGGFDMKGMLTRILRRLFTNKLAMSYSWKGLQNNIALCEHSIIQAIKDGVRRSFACTDDQIEARIKDWLRYAKKRYFNGAP